MVEPLYTHCTHLTCAQCERVDFEAVKHTHTHTHIHTHTQYSPTVYECSEYIHSSLWSVNVTVCMCFHVVSHCQCRAGGREDLSLDQDEEVQCESVRVHVTLDTVDKFSVVSGWLCVQLSINNG